MRVNFVYELHRTSSTPTVCLSNKRTTTNIGFDDIDPENIDTHIEIISDEEEKDVDTREKHSYTNHI